MKTIMKEKIDLVLVGFVVILLALLWGMQNGVDNMNLENAQLRKDNTELKSKLFVADFAQQDCSYRLLHFGKLMESDNTICDTMCK